MMSVIEMVILLSLDSLGIEPISFISAAKCYDIT